jgi:hypothetical protein
VVTIKQASDNMGCRRPTHGYHRGNSINNTRQRDNGCSSNRPDRNRKDSLGDGSPARARVHTARDVRTRCRFARPHLISALAEGEHAAILIIDECESRRHDKLAEQIPVGTNVRLLTIGPGDATTYPIQSPVWVVRRFSDDDLDKYLQSNHPNLWLEGRRLVVAYAAGNVRYAKILADQVLSQTPEAAAELLESGAIENILELNLPTGEDFFRADNGAV